MSLDEAARRAVDGTAGRLLLGTAVTVIIGFSSWTAGQIYNHTDRLAGISQKIDDLIIVEDARAEATTAAIGKLADGEEQHSIAIAKAENEIEDLRRPRLEREAASIPTVPPIVGAIQRMFTPPHSRRRR